MAAGHSRTRHLRSGIRAVVGKDDGLVGVLKFITRVRQRLGPVKIPATGLTGLAGPWSGFAGDDPRRKASHSRGHLDRFDFKELELGQASACPRSSPSGQGQRRLRSYTHTVARQADGHRILHFFSNSNPPAPSVTGSTSPPGPASCRRPTSVTPTHATKIWEVRGKFCIPRIARHPSRSVEPVVETSSTNTKTRTPSSQDRSPTAAIAPFRFRRRAEADSPVCVGRCRRRRALRIESPEPRATAPANTFAWSMPRLDRRQGLMGTGATTVRPSTETSGSPACRATIRKRSATAAPNARPRCSPIACQRLNLNSWIASRRWPSYGPSRTKPPQGRR